MMSWSHLQSLEARTLFAAVVPAGFAAEVVTQGLSNPTAMEFAPDGRAFICEQGGTLRVVKNGTLLATPFVSVGVDAVGERGLLGVAFDPNYATNHFLYVYHTVPSPALAGPSHNRVTRFTADPANPDVALAGSGVPILDLDNLSSATNHNGGAIHFGPDGKLYVAVGENGTPANAQTLSNRLGKMLRINSDGTIPTDNPFYNMATGANRAIWAMGLRNPFTFAFDPADGTMHINDVGQDKWEEIDVGRAGANYGWPTVEGPETTPNPKFDDPLYVYNHTGDPAATGNVIAGGAFYRRPAGAAAPFPDAYDGDYFYGDAGNSWVRRLDDNTANSSAFATGATYVVDLKVGPADGALYVLERAGVLERVRFTTAAPTNFDLVAASDTGVSDSDDVTRINTPTFTGKAPPGANVRLYVDGVDTWKTMAEADGTFTVTPPALAEGTHKVYVVALSMAGGGGTTASSNVITLTIDRTAPTVAASFEYKAKQEIRLQFSDDVRATLAAADLNLSPSRALVMGTTDGPTLATFAPVVPLADGDYHATLDAAAVTDVAGNPLATGVVLDFFVFAGDANHDRSVNFADLVLLAQNYNAVGGMTFDKGDFNYDGSVNFADLVLLAQRYNKTLFTDRAVAAAVAPTATSDAAESPVKSLFSATPVARPAAVKPKPVVRPARR